MRLLVWIVAAATACSAEPAAPDLGPPPAASLGRATDTATRSRRASINPRLLRRFKPIAPMPGGVTELEQLRIRLGQQLFHDKRLSRNRETSCATCHPLDLGGMDHLATSRGDRGALGVRNAPTVLNAAWQIAQFWDGRAHTLEDQAREPLLNPNEMAMPSGRAVIAVLRSIPGYVDQMAAAFPDELERTELDHALAAIAAFERALITPSRWDRFLRGDDAALSPAELAGLKLFADVGCVQCHTGELIGGSMFQRLGVSHAWPNASDLGRFAITHDANDRMVFKVSSLRNVVVTQPYFHDGRTSSLVEAVRMMARHQLDTELTDREASSIVAWLGTLTGVLSPELIAVPVLPE